MNYIQGQNFILKKEFNFFGKVILPKRTFYKVTSGGDWFIPIVKGNICPNWKIHFTLVVNNDEYFEPTFLEKPKLKIVEGKIINLH